MKIIQIMPVSDNTEDGITLKPPTVPSKPKFGDELIQGMALMEDGLGNRTVEWVVWNPKTRRIRVTSEYFDSDEKSTEADEKSPKADVNSKVMDDNFSF